ncbi:MAG TPA: MATE family efflux transporter, partial [Hyphomicrobiaceae bacterium]|nr:MATE family efflux transporter [Hyphomicrobiaceae bacterium]
VFAIGVSSVPMVGMAVGARNPERARDVAWTAASASVVALGVIGAVVTLRPDLWSSLFTSDPAVRAAANLYLRSTGWGFAFLGLGLALYFASQGAGRVLLPVIAGSVRLWVVLGGGLWLATATSAPLQALFVVIGAAMAGYGLSIAAAVYLTPWGDKRPS